MLVIIASLLVGMVLQVTGVPELITLFTPLAVYFVTLLITYLLPTIQTKIPGWLVISFIVPALSLLLTLLLPDPNMSGLAQFLYGMLSVVINEIIKQLKQAFGE